MNQIYWYTLCLDNSVPIEEIYSLINASYAIAYSKKVYLN